MAKRRIILHFPKQLVEQPITSNLTRNHDLVVNILRARVNPNETGRMVLEITGKKNNLKEGLQYLEGLGVKMRPLEQEVRWYEEQCTHCTACIPVCPSGALGLDRKKMLVSFASEHCIACELCIPVCPFHAVESHLNGI